MIVLDFDGAEGVATMNVLGLLPHVQTPSGGYHVYVKHPGRPIATWNRKMRRGVRVPGLDVRGDGGYAVFHGETGTGGYMAAGTHVPYAFDELPRWLREVLLSSRICETASRIPARLLVDVALGRAPDGRNDAGFWLACQLRDNGYTEAEAKRIVVDFAGLAGAHNSKGDVEPYTHPAARASVEQAFKRQPREPWAKANVLSTGGVDAVPISEVERETVAWLWQDRIPLGAITLLVGDPGLGKSMLSCRIAAEVSQGALGRVPAKVLMITAEDSVGAVVRPRLEAAGANLEQVLVIRVRQDRPEDWVVLPDSVADLEGLIIRHAVGLVVIDPLSAHLADGVNSWRDQSIRRALAPLHRIAEQQGTAVLVIAHLNKSQHDDPLYRIGGSIGLPGAARSVLVFARDPDDPERETGNRRTLAHSKSSYGRLAPSLVYEVESVPLADDDGEPPILTARLAERGDSVHTARDLLSSVDAKSRSALDDALEFLREELAGGPQPVKSLQARAQALGISDTTLKRARRKLGVLHRRSGFGAGSIVSLLLPDPSVIAGQPPIPQPSSTDGRLWQQPHEQADCDRQPAPLVPIPGQLSLWPGMAGQAGGSSL